MKTLRDRIIRMFVMGFRQLQDPYYQGFAAQISFYLILSIVPSIILIAQLLGVFNISIETAVNLIQEYTGNKLPEAVESLFRFSSLGFGNIIYLIIALWAGSRASFAMTRIANYTLTEGDSTGRNFFIERVRAIKTLFVTLTTIVFSIVILCYGRVILSGIFSALGQDPEKYTDSTWMWLRWPLGFLLFFIMISYNLYILPTERKPFRHVIPGSLFAAAGMLIVTGAYSYYASSLAKYDIVYGALSSVVALLMWFFFLAWVLCLAVLFDKVWEDTSVPFSKRTPPEHLQQEMREHSKFDMDPAEFGLGTIKDVIIGETPEDAPSTTEAIADAVIPKPVQDRLKIGKPKYVKQQELKEKMQREREEAKATEAAEQADAKATPPASEDAPPEDAKRQTAGGKDPKASAEDAPPGSEDGE
ncbi:MAG: YihY/virulence factor BrkB family protein [Firmicutes bacterium]|nr:YihY/virulence factor BrkB family protein [Bacillota bacterium]